MEGLRLLSTNVNPVKINACIKRYYLAGKNSWLLRKSHFFVGLLELLEGPALR
jgi:hypothetical protein